MNFTRLAAAGAALLLGCAHLPFLGAQSPRFSVERLAGDRGLSNSNVTAIAQGRGGFLWIGTQDGLNFYDGSTFTVLRPVPGDTNTIAESWITTLASGSDGSVWVGTLHGGLSRIAPGLASVRRFRNVPKDSTSLGSNEINTVTEARDGSIWVGTLTGLDRIDARTGAARHFHPATSGDSLQERNDVLAIAEAADGTLWVGTRAGLYLFDPASGHFTALPLQLRITEIRDLLLTRSGTMWLGTQQDLLAVDARTLQVLRRYDASRPTSDLPGGVNALAEGPDGVIWVATNAGVAEVDPRSGRVARHIADPLDSRSLAGPITRALLVDRGGVLWIGVESFGLAKHAPAAITFDLLRKSSGDARSLSDGYIRGIAGDRRGNVWIATQNGGLDRVEAGNGRVTAFHHDARNPASLPGENVWAFLEDRSGTMWVGLHDKGLVTFDPGSGSFTRAPTVPADASVNVLYESKSGTLYVGLESRGLYAIAPDRRSARTYGRTVGDERILLNNDVQSVLEDRQGRLWVGGADGLTRIDPKTGKATPFHSIPDAGATLASVFVTNIVEDSHGTIWVATKGGGLNRFDERTGTFSVIGTAQGLPHSFVYGVLEDSRGKLWLSTDDGIATYDPANGLVTRYGLADGLQAREFNRRAHYRAPDGTMYFGGIAGVNVFQPDRISSGGTTPVISFVSLETSVGRRWATTLAADSVIRLAHDASAFTIAFAALDFTAPEKVRYEYMLEGIDRDWVPAGTRREATYASVPTGTHVFRVRAASPGSDWSPHVAAVTFVVPPAWWATWWARALEALFGAALVLGVMRFRLRRARLRGLELERRVDEQTRSLLDAKDQLRASLEREREAARGLAEMTAAVPGVVFQLAESAEGERSFTFVSEGIARLLEGTPLPPDTVNDTRRLAEYLLTRVQPEDRAALDTTLACSRDAGSDFQLDVRWSPAETAEVRWLSVQAHATRQESGMVEWTGVMTDATPARRAESERVALESKMLEAQKAESLAVLAGGVAHDFNNMLMSVVIGAELLEYQVTGNDAALETIRRIRSAGFRAAELTQQMLAYAGKGQIAVERVDLSSLAEEMASLLKVTLPRSVRLELQTADVPAHVDADPTQLRQIVMNLVTNAGEAIGDRAGCVTVRVGIDEQERDSLGLLHASADMPARGPYAVLDVWDDGAGMEPSVLARIFDPFFTTKFTGRGLGLAALLGIVRAHHGGLKVVTAPGAGTRFSIYLPLVASPESVAIHTPPRGQPMLGMAGRILIADDEPEVREITQLVLERLGYEVQLAADGTTALELAEAGPVDLFLLDVTMPNMTGPVLARTLRARGFAAPIVLMSGYAEEDLLDRGLTADADAFLKKPFLAADLAKVLREAMAAPTR